MDTFNFLLVDDEKPFIETLAQRLRQRGFTVDCAFSGVEALSQLENDKTIDVVVIDMKMPGLDGIETVKKLKKKHPLVEVIMLTGHSTILSAVEAIKFGAFDYLTKPCDLNHLISVAKQAVSRKKEREAKIFDVRIKLYITQQERAELISQILES
ncbi:MAG: response regulator [Desulfobacula sp.]|uniref:response regulator n=1 Tax=Desulfobacula sp. TaxID=2593537 RepID=UPI0025B9CD98|nr:response regulator [Desulfobacula sp.]MCD4721450.1 response regulator [Desulfobacula sp.]